MSKYSVEEVRARFEAWVQKTAGWKACKARNKPMHLRQNADGSYNDFRVNDRWCAYKAAFAERIEADERAVVVLAAIQRDIDALGVAEIRSAELSALLAMRPVVPAPAPRTQAAQMDTEGNALTCTICEKTSPHTHLRGTKASPTAEPVAQATVRLTGHEPIAQAEASLNVVRDWHDANAEANAFVRAGIVAQPRAVPDAIVELAECRYRNWSDSAHAYRAGWNECRAAMLAAPQPGESA